MYVDPSVSYRVNEHAWTIQGEGEAAGHTAILLRLQGCPVGCHWCDVKPTWGTGGKLMSLAQIGDALRPYPRAERIVITGGEPLIYNLDHLIIFLRDTFREEIQIETSGAYPFKGEERPDWLTVSPKHANEWRVAANVLGAADELLYVVDEEYDPKITIAHARKAQAMKGGERPLIYLMPEGDPPREAMVMRTVAILRDFPEWRFSPRLQYAYPYAYPTGTETYFVTAEAERLKLVTVQDRAEARAYAEAAAV